ncbi:MAG: hypothetical protein GWM98_13375, partial [Nitrospinaceae bacterium]|nr:hypothetical protein [Nitrospinaceae bacterium]NIR55279.1 hypothetical protein [Nitrospinaceae bacterium]NIS85717.1 hypothetical protein [Nitrospinaceae bacterium]NIT82568.1 hypothetical protein [Nitrospinaceae bacterium]NIU44772.1 hypothetical protein [Nitrospinaceae bacterium]
IKTNLPTGNLENLEAVVRNIRKNPQIVREPFVTGLQFVRVSEANKEILRKFIESRVIDRRSGERHRAKL